MKTLILTSHLLKPILQILGALWAHVSLVLRLKHHGHGMPSSLLGASLLVATYVMCNLIHANITGQFSANNLLGLCLISYGYVFYLRNPVIGLLILISIITNTLALLFYWRFGTNSMSQQVLTLIEYLLIAGSMINVIKRETHAI